MLVFQLNSTAKLLPPANFYNFKIFVRKTHRFYFKKSMKFDFFEDCYNFSRLYGKFDDFAIFKDFSFSRKTEVFLNSPKSQHLNVLRNLTYSFKLYSKFVTISDFWKFQCFFRTTHLFLPKNPIFESFEKSHCFSRIRHQID